MLEHDINERAKMIAAQGIGRVLDDIHPKIRWTGAALTIEKPYHRTIDLTGHDFVLAPTILNWPDVLLQIEDIAQVTLYYPADRIGNRSRHPAELTKVIGGMRAALLTDLARPARPLSWRSDTACRPAPSPTISPPCNSQPRQQAPRRPPCPLPAHAARRHAHRGLLNRRGTCHRSAAAALASVGFASATRNRMIKACLDGCCVTCGVHRGVLYVDQVGL